MYNNFVYLYVLLKYVVFCLVLIFSKFIYFHYSDCWWLVSVCMCTGVEI